MDILWYGQACFKIKGKNTSIIIDPYNPESTGLKLPKDMAADIAIMTHTHADHNNLEAVVGKQIDLIGPGEYDIKGVAVVGVQTWHDKQQGVERGRNTVFAMQVDGFNIVHLGDLGHVLTQEQVEAIGETDILLIPVGGVYTIDAKDAVEIVSQLEPKIVIPMHYKIDGLKYELEPLENFLKEMGIENPQPQAKFSVNKNVLPEEVQVVVLNKS